MIDCKSTMEHEMKKGHSAYCCTTNMQVKSNGELVMGAGIAKWFAQEYPALPKEWGARIKYERHSNGFMISVISTFDINHESVFSSSFRDFLIAFPTKYHWRDKSDINLIEESLQKLVNATSYLGWQSVVLPRPGCSNGGLDWDTEVKPLCEKYLDDRFTVIHL